MDHAQRRAAIFAALALYATGAGAQDVTLTARDGALTISGAMRGYDGEVYRVDTEFGVLTVDAQGVLCAGPGCPDLTAFVAEVLIAGAPTMGLGLMPALLAGFAAERDLRQSFVVTDAHNFALALSDPATDRTIARLTFELHSSDRGLEALATGQADLALSNREVPEDPRGRVVALDAFVPLAARGNPLREISLADLAAVLAGEIADWGDLGGQDGMPIALHALDTGSGLQQHLEATLLAARPGGLAPGARRHDSPADLADAVSRDPFAFGVGVFSDTGSANVLSLSGPCGFSLAATPLTIKAEDYPLPAPFFVYTPPRRLPLPVREFLDYLGGAAAQSAIRRVGFVDLSPVETDINAQGARLANAILAAGDEIDLAELQRLASAMRGARRLSITYRFRDGVATLDTQSRGNLDVLARALESGTYAGREMVLVGFSDGVGPAGPNRRLALRRAGAVRAALLDLTELPSNALPDLSVESFGEAMPIACDDTEWGRRTNRRVEVWLR